MARYSAREFLYVQPLAYALIENRRFRRWFFENTHFALNAEEVLVLGEEQASLRTTPSARLWWWFNVFCPKDAACECRGVKGIETDIFLIFASSEKRTALHVEVKPPNEGFLPEQAMSYPRRAQCWLREGYRPRSVPAHQDALTAVVCDRSLQGSEDLKNFDIVHFHDEVRRWIEPYPALIDLRDANNV